MTPAVSSWLKNWPSHPTFKRWKQDDFKFQTSLSYVVKTGLNIVLELDEEQRAQWLKCLLPRHSDFEFDVNFHVNAGHCDNALRIPITGTVGTGGFLGFLCYPSLLFELQASERPCFIKTKMNSSWRTTLEIDLWPLYKHAHIYNTHNSSDILATFLPLELGSKH